MFAKIKAIWTGAKILREISKEGKIMENDVKPGWKTTEFWGARMTQVVTVGVMLLGLFKIQLTPEAQAALVQVGLSVLGGIEAGYSVSRGISKKK